MMANIADYPWSSYRIYTKGQPSKLITFNPAYLDLSSKQESRQKLYSEFVETSTLYDEMIHKTLFDPRRYRNVSP